MEFSFSTTTEEFPEKNSENLSTHSTHNRQSAFGAGRTKSFGAIVDANSGGEDQFPASSPTYGLISKVCQFRKPARYGQSVHQDEEYETSSTYSDAFEWEKRREPRAVDSIPVEPKSTKPGRICSSEYRDGILQIQEESSSEKMAVVESVLKDWQRKSRSSAWTMVDEKAQLARILEVAQAHKDRLLEKKAGLKYSEVRSLPFVRDQRSSSRDALHNKGRHTPYSPAKKNSSNHVHVTRAWSVLPGPAPSSIPRPLSTSLYRNSTVASPTPYFISATSPSGQLNSQKIKPSSPATKQHLSGGKAKQATTAFWSIGKGGSKILR